MPGSRKGLWEVMVGGDGHQFDKVACIAADLGMEDKITRSDYREIYVTLPQKQIVYNRGKKKAKDRN